MTGEVLFPSSIFPFCTNESHLLRCVLQSNRGVEFRGSDVAGIEENGPISFLFQLLLGLLI